MSHCRTVRVSHAHLSSDVSVPHALFAQHDHLLVTNHSLCLAGELRLLDGSRQAGTSFFARFRLFFLEQRCRILCTTDLGEALGQQHRDTC